MSVIDDAPGEKILNLVELLRMILWAHNTIPCKVYKVGKRILLAHQPQTPGQPLHFYDKCKWVLLCALHNTRDHDTTQYQLEEKHLFLAIGTKLFYLLLIKK